MSSASEKLKSNPFSFSQSVAEVPPFPAYQRHNRYYLDFVEFLVEDCLFKVPRYHFDKLPSTFWQSIPPSTFLGGARKLEGVLKADFVTLLEYLYPLDIDHDGTSKSPEEWKAILSLTYQWNLENHFEEATKKSKNEPLHVQVYLARACGAYDWLTASYTALVEHQDVLSIEEARLIGLDSAVKLAHLRERYIRPATDDSLSLSRSDKRKSVASLGKLGLAITGELEQLENKEVSRSVVERVMIGRQHGVAAWVKDGYQTLIHRDEPISPDEGTTLGLEITMELCQARETRIRKQQSCHAEKGLTDIPGEVGKIFQAELDRLKEITRKHGRPRIDPHTPFSIIA